MRDSRNVAPLEEDAIARALERYRALIREKGLKMSRVRDSIARAVLTYDGHFTVDELVRVLHDKGVRDAPMARCIEHFR